MKVLQLGKFYPIRGGVEKVMYDLTRSLPSAGVSCDMLCAFLKGGQMLDLPGGGRVICVPALAKKAATMISPAMVRYLRRHCGEYDLIHIHHPDPMAALALRLSGYRGKVILHWHSDILSQKLFLALYRPLQSWLVRRADAIVGTTPVYIRESPWLQNVQKNCTFVPIGIDELPEAVSGTENIRARFAGKYLILSVGRLVPYKGFRYLVDAMRLLPPEYHLVIGGMGPLQGELERQIADAGLEGRVTLTGYLPDEELPAWFRACDLFVMSSTMKTEAFGIVQIEAMACGKPVVATEIPGSGVSWVNADGVSGRNVPPGDAQALADAIQAVAQEKDKYGKAARERYLDLFTTNRMIFKMKQLYERV